MPKRPSWLEEEYKELRLRQKKLKVTKKIVGRLEEMAENVPPKKGGRVNKLGAGRKCAEPELEKELGMTNFDQRSHDKFNRCVAVCVWAFLRTVH